MIGGYIERLTRTDYEEEKILPIDTIREHTKTDDTPTVTDDQIVLYRATAFEQAELYTGRVITGTALVAEGFKIPGSDRNFHARSHRIRLSYLPVDNVVNIMETAGKVRKRIPLKRNSRKVDVPADACNMNFANCCACEGQGFEFDLRTQYVTGYRTIEDIPSTLLYGCLKFITWAIANPGDELLTVRNRLGTTETGLIGTNNGAWASGAIESWMTYKV
jgi:hypothetical protein